MALQTLRILIDEAAQTAYISGDPKFPEGNLGGKWKTFAKERSMDSKKASRRKFLKGGAAAAAVGAIQSASAQAPAPVPVRRSLKDEVAYGERSHYVTSVRVAVLERPSPDEFGLPFHVLTPLKDQVAIVLLPSLHFVGTHRGAIVPDIEPRQYRFLLHGMVYLP